MTLQRIPSKFSYLRGKFSFLFYQCTFGVSIYKDEDIKVWWWAGLCLGWSRQCRWALQVDPALCGPSSSHHSPPDHLNRRKIRLIESNAKCRFLKKFTCKGTLRLLFYLSEGPSPSMTPYSPPPLTHCIRVKSILIHTGKGEEGLTREKVKGKLHKAGRKYQHERLDLQSLNSIKHQ